MGFHLDNFRLEIAFSTAPDDPFPWWVDVSRYVEGQNEIKIARGRQDEFSDVAPSTLSGLVLNNQDGRFTPERVGSPYYPNVRLGRRLRLSYRDPADGPSNLLTGDPASPDYNGGDARFNNGTGSWQPTNCLNFNRSTSQSHTSPASLLFQPALTGSPSVSPRTVPVVPGRPYTMSAWVFPFSPGDPTRVYMEVGNATAGTGQRVFLPAGTPNNAWVRLQLTWTPTTPDQGRIIIGILNPTSTAGGVFVDDVMIDEAATHGAFTTAYRISDRFTGYVDLWDPLWPEGGDEHAVVEVTASGRTRRLAGAATLTSLPQIEITQTSPRGYYPLTETGGIAGVGLITTGEVRHLMSQRSAVGGSGGKGTIAFGSGTPPYTESRSVADFSQEDPANGRFLAAFGDSRTAALGPQRWYDSTQPFSWHIAAKAKEDADGRELTIMSLGFTQPGFTYPVLVRLPYGRLAIRTVSASLDVDTPTIAETSGSVAVLDGDTTHDIILIGNPGPTTADPTTFSVYVDGSLVLQHSAVVNNQPEWLCVGGAMSIYQPPWEGSLSHVAVWGRALAPDEIADISAAVLTGFPERSDARVARYLGYGGNAFSSYDTVLDVGAVTEISHLDTVGKTPLELMQEVTDTEGGLLFEDRSGRLVFQARSFRYNWTVAVTADAADVDPNLDFPLDDQNLVNVASVSRPEGGTVRVSDAASVRDYGIYTGDRTLATTSDAEVAAAATAMLRRQSQPHPHTPALHVDLLTVAPALAAAVRSLDLSGVIRLGGLPAQAPWPAVDLFAEGLTETISAFTWHVEVNTSRALPTTAWILGVPGQSELGQTTVLTY